MVVFPIHASIVFLVPIFFGWVLLRRVVREHDLVILIPGAVIVGFVTLMALVNELRCWLEMNMAVWFAYKILLIGSLAVLVATRPPRKPPMLPQAANSKWRIALVGTGTVLTGFYFGIPAWHGFLNDAWWFHYPVAVQIQDAAHFPLSAAFATDDPLYYHPGPDILASSLAYLLSIPVQQGFALTTSILAPATFLIVFGFASRISRSTLGGLAAACLVVAGGNLRFLEAFGTDWGNAVARLQLFNSQTIQGLLQMMFTPSHSLGIPLSLVVFVIFRHFVVRPTWPLAAVLGFLLGTLTLVAEWYFFPLSLALAICLCVRLLQSRKIRPGFFRMRIGVLLAPLAIAAAVGLYNNTYTSGIFSYFWMRDKGFAEHVFARRVIAAVEHKSFTSIQALTTEWTPPPLIPLKFNLHHSGSVPSWDRAGSNGGSWVALWSWPFLKEFFPIIAVGLPFGYLCWRRSRNLVLLLVLLVAAIDLVPPIFLDWGYRSTDFLRFFTGAFSFSAIFAGCFAASLLARPGWKSRGVGAAIVGISLANAVGLGGIGLVPTTLTTAEAIGDQGLSLSDLRNEKYRKASSAFITDLPGTSASESRREQAFIHLSLQLGAFLYPVTHGRDRAIVIVPPDELPPLQVFPEWMKMQTLSRVFLPLGWHWWASGYSTYYRGAVLTLNADAVTSLGAHWVIVTNLWGYETPSPVVSALQDRSRFAPITKFVDGPYYLTLYRAF
jgi:hypothetical protein